MKAIILLSLIVQMNILYAKDCHDCSVNKNPDLGSPVKSKLETQLRAIETPEEKDLRELLCSVAASGNTNWKRFEKIIIEKKINIEDYYVYNKCGPYKDRHIMWHSVFKANEFGVDFVEDFLKYLEKEQVRTGDNQLIYRLLNYTYDPVRKTTFLDELKITGLEPDLDVIKMISQKKYGAKSYKDLTEDDLKKGYYPEKNQVAKK